MPTGRPSKYKPEYCEMLKDHMKRGYSFESFAGIISTTKKTMYSWCEQFPDFLNAKKIGEDACRLWWETLGRGLAAGKTQGNAAVFIFNMKNRFNWSDKRDVALTGSVQVNDFTSWSKNMAKQLEAEENKAIDVTPKKEKEKNE